MKRLKTLFIIICILIVLIFIAKSLTSFSENTPTIKDIIGKTSTTKQISTKEWYLLYKTTLDRYFKYLESGDIDSAYELLSPQYKKIVTKETFESEVLKYDYTNYSINSISLRTENMYNIKITLSDNLIHDFIVILKDEESFAIVPEAFLEYVEVDEDISKDNVTYHLLGYEVDLEKCIFDIEIVNDKDEEIEISNSTMIATTGANISANNCNYKIPAKSTEILQIEFDTDVYFPQSFEIERNAGNKIRVYKFKL